jgi:hypothetical protein
MNMTMIERALKGADNDGKLLLLGVVARDIGCSEKMDGRGRYEVIRSRNDGLGSGARNAMEKSVEHLGELGVTMIAGSADFSSTKGKLRSTGRWGEYRRQTATDVREYMKHECSPKGAGMRV